MNHLSKLKVALAAALSEGAKANQTGTAKWDDALELAYTAMPHLTSLIRCAEFLADAMPGIEAYANSLDNPNYQGMWHNQISKYKEALADLSLADAGESEKAELRLLSKAFNLRPEGQDTSDAPETVLKGTVQIDTGSFHVLALQVKQGDDGVFWAVSQSYADDLDSAYQLSGDSLTSVEIDGLEYVIVVYPFSS